MNLGREFDKESTSEKKKQANSPPPPPPPPSPKQQHITTSEKEGKLPAESPDEVSNTSQTTETQPLPESGTGATSSTNTPSLESQPSSQKPSSLKESKYKSFPSNQTKVQANLAGSPLNSTRYSMNFSVTKEQKGTSGLREALMTIFTTMKELCADVVICPWKDNEKPNLKTPDSIPSTITLLQK